MNRKCFGFLTQAVTIALCTLTISLPMMAATLYGDLNSDGKVDSADYTLMRKGLMNNTISSTIVADVNGDGKVDSADYTLMRRYLLRIISSFPVETSTTPTTTPTLTATPTPTLAAGEQWELNRGAINLGNTITYTGTGISVSGSVVTITAGGDHDVTGTLTNGMICVNTTEKVKLRLSGASITNSTGPAIYCQSADKLFITLDANTTNTLADGKTYSDTNAKGTIFSNDDLEIKGKGTLNITGNYNHAICSDDDINVENGIINVKSAVNDGIHANGSIDVTGGTLNITATTDAIQNEDQKGITIDAGTLTLSAGDQGIRSKTGVSVAGGITINGGTINITKAREGISAQLITVNGGTISIIASDDGFNASMGGRSFSNDGSQLIINGGSVYASAQSGDALDANGSITIKGGTVIAVGPQSSPNVPVDCNGPLTVTGGTLLATGPAMMMAQYPDGASAQYSIAVGLTSSQTANSAVCVKDSSGKVLLITKPIRNYINVLFSSHELKNGSTYTVCTGGTVSGGTETNGVITGGTYSGGIVSTLTVTTSPTTTSNWTGGGGFPGGW